MDDSSEDNPIPGSSLYNTQALPDWGGGVLPHNTFQGMCWPTESWFWDSWFGTGYPFSGRFLEWCIIFRRYESLKTDYQQPFEKFALTNIPKYLPPPPPGHVNRNTIMAVGTEDLTILEIYMVEREIEEQMVNLPLLFTTWFVAENICSFCKMTRACF